MNMSGLLRQDVPEYEYNETDPEPISYQESGWSEILTFSGLMNVTFGFVEGA